MMKGASLDGQPNTRFEFVLCKKSAVFFFLLINENFQASGRNRSALCELKLRRQKREQISCFETSIFKLKEAYEVIYSMIRFHFS